MNRIVIIGTVSNEVLTKIQLLADFFGIEIEYNSGTYQETTHFRHSTSSAIPDNGSTYPTGGWVGMSVVHDGTAYAVPGFTTREYMDLRLTMVRLGFVEYVVDAGTDNGTDPGYPDTYGSGTNTNTNNNTEGNKKTMNIIGLIVAGFVTKKYIL